MPSEEQITLELLDKALRRAEASKDAYTVAVLQLEQGAFFVRGGKPRMAKLAWSEAEAAALACGAAPEATEAATQRGQMALDAQHWTEALEHLARAAASPGFAAQEPARRAAILHNLGYAQSRADQWEGAAASYRRALQAWEEAADPPLAARLQSWLNLGEALLRLKLYGEAVGPLRAAWEAQRKLTPPVTDRLATNAELLSWALHRAEAPEQAVEPLRDAARLWEQAGQREALMRCLLDLAELSLSLSEAAADAASPLAEEGLQALQRWIALAQRPEAQLFGWWRLSQARQARGELREAAEALVQAAEAQRKANTGDGAELLRKAAELELRAVRASDDEARDRALERALWLFDRLADTEAAAWCRRQQVEIATAREDWAAVAALLGVMREAESPPPAQAAALLAHQAQAFLRAGRDLPALEAARAALALLHDDPGPLQQALSTLVEALAAGAPPPRKP
jgi:tetratricopeptide (TPR) repeat protein